MPPKTDFSVSLSYQEENCGNLSSILLCNHMRSFPDDLQEVPNQTFDQERATLTGGLQAANEALTAEKDLLLQKLENLSKEMKSQGEDKRKLTEEVKILSKEKIQLIEQADALCLKNEHMKSQLEEMSADRISLTAQITTLARDKKRVVALLKGFNKEKQLSEEVDVLSREIIDLKAEVQKLTRVQTEIVGREDVLSQITAQLALLLKEKMLV